MMGRDQESFSKRCRLCGRCHKGSLDISLKENESLKELIKQCLHINIREDDALPKKLCQHCKKKLYMWEKFKTSCEKVQVKLIADSPPDEHYSQKEVEDDKSCNGIENSNDEAYDKSSENTGAVHKGIFKSSIPSKISSTMENALNSRRNDEEILRSKLPNRVKKSCFRKAEAFRSAVSKQILEGNQNQISTVDLNPIPPKSEGKVNDINGELKFEKSPQKASQITDQDECDMDDTLSKNINSSKTVCIQVKNSVNLAESCADEEENCPNITKRLSCVTRKMKCNGNTSLRKKKILHKLIEGGEMKNSMKSIPMKELQCPICPRKLSSVYNLNHHLDTHSEKCNYCCHLCGKLFKTRSSLSNHVRVHLFDDAENIANQGKGLSGTSSSVRLFQCEICDKKFRQSGHLSYHLKMHSGVRSHICNVCGKCFTEKYQLQRHENAVHNKLKRYTCNVCGKQFLHTHNFKDHKLQHEGIAKISCDLCGKTFLTSNALSRHQRLHTGVKPFSCDICGKKFRDCSNRKRHWNKHTEEEKKGLSVGKEGSTESNISVEEIIEVTEKEGEVDCKVKKTYMNLKTYFESTDDVSMKEDVKEGMLNIVATQNPELLQSMSNDSSSSGPLLDCGLFEEEVDLNPDGLLLIGDGRIGCSMIGGSESHNLKDQLVWVPSSDIVQSRDECLNNICTDDDELRSRDIVLGDVGIQMGLCGMQAADITGILEVGMGLCSDFDVGSGIDLDSGKDGLSNNFPIIGDIKEVVGEKAYDNVLHLQVF